MTPIKLEPRFTTNLLCLYDADIFSYIKTKTYLLEKVA